MQRIKIMDSMRGLAATIVVFHHLFTRLPELFNGKFPLWLEQVFEVVSELNVQAVLFFFFISGFSICLSLKNELPVTKASINIYVYKRLKRIMPLYYFAILFTLLVATFTNTVSGNDDYSLWNLVGNILFLQCSKSYDGNWFAPYGGNGPLWSLSFEVFYYFFLPIFLLLLFKGLERKKMTFRINRIALLFAFIISIGCIIINKFFFFPFVAFATLFYVWYAGFFTASMYLIAPLKFDGNFLLLISITVLLVLMNNVIPSATLSKLLFGSAIATAFIPMFILRKKMQRIFTPIFEKPFNFLFYKIGTGSYALYLLHFPVILQLQYFGCKFLLLAVLSLTATTIGSIWLEKLFSKPAFLFLKQDFIK